jgi:hypothetical protein
MSRLLGTLNLHITSRAQREISQLLQRGPTPCWPALMLGVHIGENIGYWSVELYVAENLDGLSELYDQKGIPLLYECHGHTFAIPQTNLLPHLDGATLDFENDEYVLDRTGPNSDT